MFLFVVMAGLVFTFLVPPFQKPDEIDHFYKSVGLLNLRNCSIGELCVDKKFYDLPKRTQAEVQRWDYSKKFDYKLLFFEDDDRSIMSYAANFSWQANPMAYVFSAIGVWIGSFFPNPLVALYLGRLFNFCFFLICFVMAIRIIPKGYKQIILLFAALPMVLHQVTAVGHDAVWLALLLIVFSWWLKIWEQNQTKFKEYLFFVLTVLIFAFVRYGNWFIFLIVTLVPRKKVNKIVYWTVLSFLTVLMLVVAVSGVEFWQKIGFLGVSKPGNFYGFQSDILVKYPLIFLRSVLNSFVENSRLYFEGLIGRFGWLDYKLDFGVYLIYLVWFWAVLKSIADRVRIRMSWKCLLGLFFVIIICILSIFVGMYLYEGLPGERTILVQGRYFLVLLPFSVYFLVGVWQKPKGRELGWLIPGLVLFLVLINIFGVVKKRYYDYSDFIDKPNYLDAKWKNYVNDTTSLKNENYLVNDHFTFNWSIEDTNNQIRGFEFAFSSDKRAVDIPYMFFIKDKDCQKVLDFGFLDQRQLTADGIYRHNFGSKKFDSDEICLWIEPYYKNDKANYLSIVNLKGEFFIRLLKPRKYLLEELKYGLSLKKIKKVTLEDPIYQTFQSNRNNLTGIGILTTKYDLYNPVDKYKLTVLDEKCLLPLREIQVDNNELENGEFTDVFFDPVKDSQDKRYCFSLSISEGNSLLGIYFSDNNLYNFGESTIGEKKMDTDVVFRLIYN